MADIEAPRWKDKIKAGQLMNRVLKHANGEIEMTKSQLQAAQIYLKKVIPDLSATTVSGDKDNPLFGDPDARLVELGRKTGIDFTFASKASPTDDAKLPSVH